MLNNYMGILCLNEKDSNIKSLTQNRPLASIPLGGRYRIIDFILSNMVNSGIKNKMCIRDRLDASTVSNNVFGSSI